MSKHDEQAYSRGVRAAGIWKRLKHTVASWDQRGTAWAKNHNIPVWIGRVPLVAAILISLTCLIAGGFIVALIVAFIWAITFILQNFEFRNAHTEDQSNDKRNDFYDEFTMNSAINNEYDGAPYRSPGGD
ncbi:hypothetical protein ACU62C_22510 [Klebsiella aerogenes]